MSTLPYIVQFSEGREPTVFVRDETASKKLSEAYAVPNHRREEPVAGQKYSHAQAEQLAKDIVWLASVHDNIQWLRDYTASKNAQGPTAAEFSTLVEAEMAKGLTEVEALHAVASDYPQLYDAYRNEAFIDGSIK